MPLTTITALLLLLPGLTLPHPPPPPALSPPALSPPPGLPPSEPSPSPGTVPSASSPKRERHIWPLSPIPQVVRPFHPPPTPYASGHRGVDLSAPPGAKVMASAKGTVVHAAQVATRPLISLHHEDGTRTTYEPVVPAVRKGDRVTAGTQLGTLLPAHPGCPTPACLHWAAFRPTNSPSRAYANPLSLLRPPRPRLLPSHHSPHSPSPTPPRSNVVFPRPAPFATRTPTQPHFAHAPVATSPHPQPN
ncbi:M23 family metallopeptidase [Actinosynnema pretiosum subsp. pretiosum]|uniref:M23 family metallopeptidase n=1 Tax=Actinosynnema pretiosum subsp. pretiosum TaxID=103721 RepID=A0AA45R2W3_9PSEU|nr:M23 family metallopeptidase [Actinosynnema pretiosum subsp. pretiosum]